MKSVNYLLLAITLCLSCTLPPAQAALSINDAPLTEQAITKLDINKASAEQLTALPGVGIKKAEQIVKYRELNGDFNSVEELVNVKGIGVKMVAKIVDLVSI